jgi:hypothetical protein
VQTKPNLYLNTYRRINGNIINTSGYRSALLERQDALIDRNQPRSLIKAVEDSHKTAQRDLDLDEQRDLENQRRDVDMSNTDAIQRNLVRMSDCLAGMRNGQTFDKALGDTVRRLGGDKQMIKALVQQNSGKEINLLPGQAEGMIYGSMIDKTVEALKPLLQQAGLTNVSSVLARANQTNALQVSLISDIQRQIEGLRQDQLGPIEDRDSNDTFLEELDAALETISISLQANEMERGESATRSDEMDEVASAIFNTSNGLRGTGFSSLGSPTLDPFASSLGPSSTSPNATNIFYDSGDVIDALQTGRSVPETPISNEMVEIEQVDQTPIQSISGSSIVYLQYMEKGEVESSFRNKSAWPTHIAVYNAPILASAPVKQLYPITSINTPTNLKIQYFDGNKRQQKTVNPLSGPRYKAFRMQVLSLEPPDVKQNDIVIRDLSDLKIEEIKNGRFSLN